MLYFQTKNMEYSGSGSSWATMARPIAMMRATMPSMRSVLARVDEPTAQTPGMALAIMFKLAKSPERHWRRLNGPDRLADIIRGVRFSDGTPVHYAEDQAAA
jgi:hypothetical protein